MNDHISVIIPVRNMAGTIIRAIDSAINVHCLNVVVADDNSDDGTRELAAYYPSDFVGTVLTMQGSVPVGVCGARNRAIQHAQFDWILPLDGDDELLPDAFYILRQHMRPSAGGGYFIYTGYTDGDGYHSPPPIGMITRKNVAHATFLFHRSDWLRVGGYDPMFNIGGEDWALMLALLNAGVEPIRVDQPIYRRYTDGSASSPFPAVTMNARTDRARTYWPTIMQLAREKYPAVFRDGVNAVATSS